MRKTKLSNNKSEAKQEELPPERSFVKTNVPKQEDQLPNRKSNIRKETCQENHLPTGRLNPKRESKTQQKYLPQKGDS